MDQTSIPWFSDQNNQCALMFIPVTSPKIMGIDHSPINTYHAVADQNPSGLVVEQNSW
jgi:hypothetical protein